MSSNLSFSIQSRSLPVGFSRTPSPEMSAGICVAPAVSISTRRNLTPYIYRTPLREWMFVGATSISHHRSTARGLAVCFVVANRSEEIGSAGVRDKVRDEEEEYVKEISEPVIPVVPSKAEERMARKEKERTTYLMAAVLSSLGITSMAAASVYYRFVWQMEGGEIPMTEMFGTFALSIGAAVGMEFWAQWAHRALWHSSLWHMHESHHRPREGPFELNDVFAIINAVPAIALMSYGFFNKGLFPGLCFGAGLGITVFGMAYMFVHDGLVHRRFPVGPIANVPYFRKVAAAHQLHHADKFDGVPYGLFLGPKELEEVGGAEELEKEIQRRIRMYERNGREASAQREQ